MDLYRFNLIKERYYHELDQRDRISQRTSMPIAIITLLLGGAFSLFEKLPTLQKGHYYGTFIVFFVFFTISLFISIYSLFRSLWGYRYLYLPKAKVIDDFICYWETYYDNNIEYYQQERISKKDLVEEATNKKLYDLYIECTDQNIESNEKKVRWLFFVGFALLSAIIFGSVSLYPYYKSLDNIEVQKVELIGSCNSNIKGGDYVTDEDKIPAPPTPTPPEIRPRQVNETFTKDIPLQTPGQPIQRPPQSPPQDPSED